MSRDRNRVKGLTTAAAIWLVAAIGMTCGAGLLVEALIATVLGLIVLVVLRSVERLFLPHQLSATQHIKIEAETLPGQFIGQVCEILSQAAINVQTLEVRHEQDAETLTISCRIPDPATLGRVISELRVLPGVHAVHADLPDTKMGKSMATQDVDQDS